MEPEWLQVNGRQLYIERHGSPGQPVVVLLHHGLGAVQSWDAQIPVLVAAHYQVLAYDRWGYGRSQARSGFSMPAFDDDLADLQAILDHYQCDCLNLVGHSDGGTIALYYTAMSPQPVARLVTVAAHVYVEPKMDAGILDMRRAFDENERFQAGLRRLHGEKADGIVARWFDGWHRSENLQWDMRPLLAQITCPALVVQGEADEHASPQHARDLAEAIPDAALWIEPGAGHMLPQEQAERFNQGLLAFLRG